MIPPIIISLFTPLSQLNGVGPKRFDAYKRLNCSNVRDLIFHLPTGLLKRKINPDLGLVKSGDTITQLITVNNYKLQSYNYKKRPSIISCSSPTGDIDLIFFNMSSQLLKDKFKIDKQLIISGTVTNVNKNVEIIHPDAVLEPSEAFKIRQFEPIYPASLGLNSKFIGLTIQHVIKTLPNLLEWIPENIIKKFHFTSWLESIKALHSPKSEEEISIQAIPRKRLAFDEVFAQQLALQTCRLKNNEKVKEPLVFKGEYANKLKAILPFELTDAQLEAISEIEKDQKSHVRMSRLIQGDVGSGKTLVALIAMLNAYESGLQSVIMAPTEILALQHFKNIFKYCNQLGIECDLLIGAQTPKQASEIRQKIASGATKILIGTHAVFQSKVEFANLGLVVVDEQHRFGVKQREALLNKGVNADFMMMSATPIPRTLEMINYGDMDVSNIRSKPKNRLDIITSLFSEKKMLEIISALKNKIDSNEKIYWVCPLIEESEKVDLSHVQQRYEILNKHYIGKVGLIHGKMKQLEREAVMQKFINGEILILVATTVIEVGVDVPEATLMVIENSERFGLTQLHQLRGRVGRGDKQSHCFLIYNYKLTDIAKKRLQVMRESTDGFYLSEQDLTLRGGGDIVGNKQSGLPDFKFYDYKEHFSLLKEARLAAQEILKNKEDDLDIKYQVLHALFDRSVEKISS